MAAEELYFGRKYKLTIGDRVFETEEGRPAMDIKFNVKYARGQTAKEGTISVLGLSWKTIEKILALSSLARGDAMAKKLRIKLEAGYFTGAGMVEIMDGFVYYATVTSPPEMWLNMLVNEYDPNGGKYVKLSDLKNPQPIRTTVEMVLKSFEMAEGVKFKLLDKTQAGFMDDQTPIKTSFKGESWGLKDALTHLSEKFSDKVLFIMRTYHSENGERHIEAHSKNQEGSIGPLVTVDANNGLLSVSGITAVNATVTTFLDGRWDDQLSYMQLKSKLNPQSNGRYIIVEKEHTGHFNGKEWYTKYSCSERIRS